MAKKKKKAAKKKGGKKKASKKAAPAAAKPPTKGQLYNSLAEANDLKRKDVAGVFDTLGAEIKKSLRKHGSFTIPGLCKLVVKKKPRVPAGERYNPFTKESKWGPAKPASKTVKARPMKGLKDMV
jgi:nucleoid DNA-binding protein